MVDFIIDTFNLFISFYNQVLTFFNSTIDLPIVGEIKFFEIFTTFLVVILVARLVEKLPLI